MSNIEFKTEQFSKILNGLIQKAKLSASSIARNCNIPESTVRRLRNDKEANPTAANLIALAKFFNVSVDQLLGLKEISDESDAGGYKPLVETWTRIPVLNWAEVIHWSNIDTTEHPKISVDFSKDDVSYSLIIPPLEYDEFKSQALAIVSAHKKPKHRDYVITHRKNQEKATLKQFIEHDGEYFLSPLNKNFEIVKLNNDYNIIGTVIQIRMDLHNGYN